MNPASFMHPLGSRDYGTGNVYEMRTYPTPRATSQGAGWVGQGH